MKISQVEKAFRCLARIEAYTAQLYMELSLKAPDPEASSIFLFIALDSSKHSRVFKKFSQESSRVTSSECKRILGQVYSDTCKLLRRIRRETKDKVKLDNIEFLGVLEKLLMFESSVGEEYLTLISARELMHLVSPEEVKTLLRLIAEDEERHAKLIEQLKIKYKLTKTKG